MKQHCKSAHRQMLRCDYSVKMNPINDYITQNKEKFFNELNGFIKFKSISADSCYAEEMINCQKYLMNLLKNINAKTSILATKGINAVYGEIRAHKNSKTVLVYGHYDVQPAQKDDGWEKDPFSIHKKDDKWFARGIADDKGPVFAIIKAIETLQNTIGLKVNIKFLIEGEEECGSKNLDNCIKRNKARLKNDVVLVCDTEWLTKELPCIPYGLKGLMYAYIRVNGPSTDLHSGTYGGIVKNPHLELARILTQLKDENEKVLIPKFYDKVKQVTNEEKQLLNEIPFDVKHLKKELGTELTSDDKVELLTKKGCLPTLDVHGITGGYTGAGAKTIIPSYAEAKISTRLVPDQNPEEVFNELVKKVKSINSSAIIIKDSFAEPFLIDPKNAYIQKAAQVMNDVFGKKPVFVREGGSIPVTVTLNKELNTPIVLFGINNADCSIHSPKENLDEKHFHLGIEAIAKYLDSLSKCN